MILGSFGEPVGAKIDLGTSFGTHCSPKWLPESPRVPFWSIWWSFWVIWGPCWVILVDLGTMLGHFGGILGSWGCQIGAKNRS